jgi:hypothetical protein
MMMGGLVVTAALALAACGYGASFGDCTVACSAEASECPSGFTCSTLEGRCRNGATTLSCASILGGDGDAGADTIEVGSDADVDAGLDGGVDGAIDGAATSCPAAFGGTRYLFVNMLVTWQAAESYCTMLDSTPASAPYVHLVVVSDAQELTQLIPPSSCGQPADDSCKPWLGYSDIKLGAGGSTPDPTKFLWVTDEPGLVTWASDQPDESTPPRCAYRDSDGLMHDRTCEHTRSFYCECDQFRENPSNL